MGSFWKVFIGVVLALIITGGGTYYYMNQKAIDEKADLQDQIDGLNNQIEALQSSAEATSESSSIATTKPTTTTTSDWKDYSNIKYGFSLTFNDLWKSYEIIEKEPEDSTAMAYLYVCVPTTSSSWTDEKSGMFCPFVITVVSAGGKSAFEQANDPMIPTYLGANTLHAFYTSSAQDRPNDGVGVMNDLQNIIATFKAVN
jgi:hypothetical protein